MKLTLLYTFTFLLFFESSAQLSFDKTTDEPVLKGNIILEGSSRIGRARMFGYYLQNFSILECGSGEELDGKDKISSIENQDSSLVIRISVEKNCCKNFLSEIEIVEDSILNIICHDYGLSCLCNCNYCMDYKITYSPRRINLSSSYLKKDLFVRYVMINWNRKSILRLETKLTRK